MVQMKDSKISPQWVAEQMRANPPRIMPNGNIFSGPVRLSFANIFEPGKPGRDAKPGVTGKYGATLLFPPGTDFTVFNQVWMQAARAGFPDNWAPDGTPVGLHIPFHRQDEKAFGPQAKAGYTPGGLCFACTSKYKPPVVDGMAPPNADGSYQQVLDARRCYSGVWAFVGMNAYKYTDMKKGIAFGLQTVMLIADDSVLGGAGGDPTKDFAGITITAQTNVADRFANLPTAQGMAPGLPTQGILPAGGHMGLPGNMPIQPVGQPLSAADLY